MPGCSSAYQYSLMQGAGEGGSVAFFNQIINLFFFFLTNSEQSTKLHMSEKVSFYNRIFSFLENNLSV